MIYDLLPMPYLEAAYAQVTKCYEESGTIMPDPFPLENAIEVITGDQETEEEAVTWLYTIGAEAAGNACYVSYQDAFGEEEG